MELNAAQKDALTELINIGYGRAAGALSELTGYRITLEVPKVTMHEITAIVPMLEDAIKADVASVDQKFTGALSGNALLILDQDAALMLSKLLTEEGSTSRTLDSNAREIITEVGNILLNACLGVFGNLLRVQVNFAVPRLQVDTVKGVLDTVGQRTEENIRYGLMIHTRFYVKAGNVAGYLIIILGLPSLDRLLHELDNWEKRQVT